jgi:cell division protein FtsW (lipid II flippase)
LADTYHDLSSRSDRREIQLLGLAFVFLLASCLAVTFAPGVRTGSLDLSLDDFEQFIILPVWVTGVSLIVRMARVKLPNRDPYLLPIGAMLAGWGLITIWRLTPTFGARQTAWFFLASVLVMILFRMPTNLKWLRDYRYLWLGAGLFLLSLTLLFGTNPLGGDPKLWLGCCGLYFQPSEPLRLLLVAFLASYFADRLVFHDREHSPTLLQTVIPLLIVWSFSILLLFVQRDLGTGSLFLILLAVLLYIASGKWQVLLTAGGMTVIGGVFAYMNMDLVRTRVDAWLNPWLDPVGGSYQIVQSLIAFSSGGIFGSGLGLGEPGLVPAAHTDFIFATVGEEWGLLGTLAILCLYATLVARGIKIASRDLNHFDRLLAAGLSIAFGLQSILIISGVTRLLPLTGITLPFVSYGGSSLVTSFIALGLLMQISNKTAPQTEISKPLKATTLTLNAAWLMIGLVLCWWSVYRAPALTKRTDNLRKALSESYFRRGSIYDASGEILAQSVGEVGNLQRSYPYGESTSILGYQSIRFGKAGIESSMDAVLHGDEGNDPFDLAWSILLKGFPSSGFDIMLTLDAQVQEYAAELMSGQTGALVVLDSNNGDILSMITSPSYDPNLIETEWEKLITDASAPLVNRTTQARYQPGMAIVPFLIAWGEQTAQFSLDTPSPSAFSTVQVGEQELGCAMDPPSGLPNTLQNALESGCPGAFASLATELGPAWLLDAYDAFGFIDETPLRLATANALDLPSGAEWEHIELDGIGQGQLVITPVQMARAFTALTSGGQMHPPKIVQSVRNSDGRWLPQQALGLEEGVISPTAAQRIMNTSRLFANGVRSFSFTALTGPEGQISTWFMGIDLDDRVLVIFLEGGPRTKADEIAVDLFKYIQ